MHILLNRLPPLLLGLVFGLLLNGCQNARPEGDNADVFFNLDTYFAGQVRALNDRQPEVLKTVRNNGEEEQRTIKEIDWAAELKSFRGADINKPAWRTSYSIDSANGGLTYRALDDELRVRSLQVLFAPGGRVRGVIIEREVHNYLYTSSERLEYYPDSLYSVERHQDVRVLGSDEFQVIGKF